MDFLENVVSVVGSAAHSVVKKSGEVVEYSKLKYAMFDVSNTIKTLEAEIGEAVYKSYKDSTPLDEGIKEKCMEIERLSEQLEAYADQLSGIKSAVKCPSCGKNVKDTCTFCPYCGEKLASDVEADFSDNSSEYYSTTSAHAPGDNETETNSNSDSNSSEEKNNTEETGDSI